MKQFLRHIFLLLALCVATTSLFAQTYNGGTWYSLYDTDDHTRTSEGNFKEKVVFAPAESITFEYKRLTAISIKGNIEVQNKIGSNWSGSKGSIRYDSYKDWSTSPSFALDEDISHVRCVMTSGNGGQVQNHFVKLAKHIRIADGGYGKTSETKSFGNVTIGNISGVQTVKLRSFLTTNNITITSNNAAFRVGSSSNQGAHVFNVGANACASTNGKSGTPAGGGTLGDINLYDINIYFVPTTASQQSGTITITDGTSIATITVTGTGLAKETKFAWTIANTGAETGTFYVDDNAKLIDIYTLTDLNGSDIKNELHSHISFATNNSAVVAIENGNIIAKGAGNATITAKFSDGYNGWKTFTKTLTLTIVRHDLTASMIQTAVWNQTISAPFTIKCQNHSLLPDSYTVTSLTPNIATYDATTNTIQTYFTSGTAKFRITREADHKYEGLDKILELQVAKSTASCKAIDNQSTASDIPGNDNAKSEIFTLTGTGDILTFKYRLNSSIGDATWMHYITPTYSVDGKNFKTIKDANGNDYREETKSMSDKISQEIPIPADAKYIQFVRTANGTGGRTVKLTEINVTRKKVLDPSSTSLTLPHVPRNTESTATFSLAWSTCMDEIRLTTDNELFKVNLSSINSSAGGGQQDNIQVTFTGHATSGTYSGNIIIYDQSQLIQIPVSCEVKEKLQTRIEYRGESHYSEAHDCIEGMFVVIDENGNTVTGANIVLKSSNSDILSVCGNGGFMPHCGGQVTIKATFAEDAAHRSASLEQTITVDKCIPTITWTQSLSNFETNEDGTINEERQLTAVADPAAFPITYTLDAEAQQIAEIITKDGKNYIRVFGIGTGRITASITGGTFSGREYTSASSVKLLRVRKPGECDPYSLFIDEEQNTTGWGTIYKIYDIKGLPENTMIFGAHVNTGSINNSLYVDFSLDGISWTERQLFTIGEEYKWDYTCPVPDKARYVRFETKSSLLTFFNMVTIRQQTYLRTDKNNIHIDAIVNQPFSTALTVEYSNKPTIEYAISNTNQLGLKLTPDRDVDNTCDEYGSYTFTLEGTIPYPLTETVTEYITLTTSAGDNITIPVTINATLLDEIYYYTNTNGNWSSLENWRINETLTVEKLPTSAHRVVLSQPVTIDKDDAIAYSITIQDGGSLTVLPTGGLTVHAGGFTGANEQNLILHNMQSGAGYIRISPYFTDKVAGDMPKMKVLYETASTLDNGANLDATWQYIGAPGADCQFTVDYITWLYHWSEKEGWINKTGTLTLEPFAGYAITQYGKPTYELVSTVINQNKTITLTKTTGDTSMDGDNLFANSYSAPLDAKNFTPEDFSDYGKGSDDIVKTFYIFNSGSWNDWNKNQSNTLGNNNSDTPGQYRAIPALAAEYLNTKYDQTTISPMQGVYMIANTSGATITLNYDKHVWKAGSAAGTNMHEPMRAPIHNVFKLDNFRRLRIQVNSTNSGADRMYVIQDTITTTDYDNGYDAPNQLAEGLANIYTNEHFGQMEVSCSNHIDSTFVGFTAGSDSIYTLRFNAIIGDDLHLLDLDNDSLILLEEDATYTFHATPHSKNDLRFQILLHPEKNLDFGEEEKDEIYTGITDVHTTQVWSHGSCIYISNAPTNTIATLYNISGHKLLTTPIHHTPYTLDLSYLPKGVYMLQLNTQVYKFVIQ